MKTSLFRAALIAMSMLLSSLVASAQEAPLRHRQWETSAYLGPSFIPDISSLTQVSGGAEPGSRTVGMQFLDGYETGIRITEHLGDYWMADLGYSFANQPLRFTNLAPDVPTLSLSQYVHRFPYNVSLTPMKRSKRFRPYGTLGIGAVLFQVPDSSRDAAALQGVRVEDSWGFFANWGGGFKYLLRDQFAIRFDARDHISGIPSYGLPSTAQIIDGQFRPGIARNGLLHNWQFNIGLAIQWDE